MKTNVILLALASAATPALAVDKTMPDAFPEDRYQTMIARSPFGLATPVAAPVVPDKSFADGWYLAGVSQFDGKNYVAVRSRDLSVTFSLYGDEANTQEGPGYGVKLQNVEWSPTYGRTSATIEKDGQFAKIELLNQSEMATAAPAAQMNPGGMAKPQMINPGYPQPLGGPQPRNAIPRPSGQPIVPAAPSYQITPGVAPAGGAQPAQPLQPGAPGGDNRRRIRVIPSQPGQ